MNMDTTQVQCPNCSHVGRCQVVPEWKHVNQLALILGGILLPVLWQQGKKTKFKCLDCTESFGIRTLAAKISFVLFWIPIAFIPFVVAVSLLAER
jgi:DNA-directed RNA polymerase subunit RPC12/RpoP